ncbi:MAG: CPBP family intramembrane metalloprotease [Treponema sp.]|jgi:membrane protease YdiL (CAAX protease family)|nr:CPBP family intramembrane metalloprotease [Treponema sp.]
MAAFVEPIILYWLLFLPSWGFPAAGASALSFSINQELSRIAAYNFPALALIWYLLFHARRPISSFPGLWPRRGDLVTFLFTLPALAALGALISLLGTLFPDPVSAPEIGFPQGSAAFWVMILSCLSTGYLEEAYFRFYLFRRLAEGGIGLTKAALISSLLFALCHTYEGSLGALNAFLAGLLLFFVFARRRSLHGIAWAHGGYNIFVYVMAGIAAQRF